MTSTGVLERVLLGHYHGVELTCSTFRTQHMRGIFKVISSLQGWEATIVIYVGAWVPKLLLLYDVMYLGVGKSGYQSYYCCMYDVMHLGVGKSGYQSYYCCWKAWVPKLLLLLESLGTWLLLLLESLGTWLLLLLESLGTWLLLLLEAWVPKLLLLLEAWVPKLLLLLESLGTWLLLLLESLGTKATIVVGKPGYLATIVVGKPGYQSYYCCMMSCIWGLESLSTWLLLLLESLGTKATIVV